MKTTKGQITKHILLATALSLTLIVIIIYPFCSGESDALAMPLSILAQLSGILGLLLVPVGLICSVLPGYRFNIFILFIIVGLFMILFMSLTAKFSVGNSFGIITLVVLIYVGKKIVNRIKVLKKSSQAGFTPLPLYLIIVPSIMFLFQVFLAAPVTKWSRVRAITNAKAFINDIEAKIVCIAIQPGICQQIQEKVNRDGTPLAVQVINTGSIFYLISRQPIRATLP